MRGLLFYDQAGAERNAWFIDRMVSVARENGDELIPVITDSISEALSRCTPLPDFAVVRTISPQLSRELEKMNVPTYNNARVAEIANDKYATYLYARRLGIAVMDTVSVTCEGDIPDGITYPRVMKTVDGHGGSEVFLVNSLEECKEILALHPNRRFVLQELSSQPGVDMRVYILGGEVLAAVKRTSKSDFRSNFSLGGKAELYELDQKEKDAVQRIARDLGADLCGIDFIRHRGEWVLNEIEDVVGTRMLYSLTDTDAAEVYIKYVAASVKERHKEKDTDG